MPSGRRRVDFRRTERGQSEGAAGNSEFCWNLQLQWQQTPEPQRQVYRAQWKAALQPLVTQAGAAPNQPAPAQAGSSTSFDAALQKETNSAWTHSLNQSMMTQTMGITMNRIMSMH